MRPNFIVLISSSICFNSRTREGATFSLSEIVFFNFVSIHAPVRVRLVHITQFPIFIGFNSRTREGATGETIEEAISYMFQFTHP